MSTRARCGWPKPVLPKGAAVAHCADCHGQLRFDLHVNQWVHTTAQPSSTTDQGADHE